MTWAALSGRRAGQAGLAGRRDGDHEANRPSALTAPALAAINFIAHTGRGRGQPCRPAARRPASVPRVGRFLVFGPVFDFAREIGARHVGEVLGHVHRFLVAQAALAQRESLMEGDGHVAFDEGGGGVGARPPPN